jgi:4-nitrophenol 2-monooxygenase / 4-nitrocatechol 4-monooxygenase, reductase component
MSSSAAPVSRGLSADDYRACIGQFASGVTIVTTRHDGELFGATASAVCSLSLEPPMLVVCLNRTSSTAAAVQRTGLLAVNILGADQAELARLFAQKGPEKFDQVEMAETAAGHVVLPAALARLKCRVANTVAGGTHWVFLAEVDDVDVSAGAPLVCYRGELGGFRRLAGADAR